MSLIKRAERKAVYVKGGLVGASGSGKTYSALLLAKGFMGSLDKVCVIDTENGSANLYEDLGPYSVLPFSAPFSPQRFVSAIQMAVKEGFEFIIIDSSSHEWDGPGGCLEIHSNLGGKFQDWNVVTPMHKAFINEILQSKAHVFVTMRKKYDYAITEANGKKKVEKLGMKEVQREGFEYELTVNFEIDSNHMALASKDRTSMFSDGIPFRITEETGRKLKEWSKGRAAVETKTNISEKSLEAST